MFSRALVSFVFPVLMERRKCCLVFVKIVALSVGMTRLLRIEMCMQIVGVDTVPAFNVSTIKHLYV